MTRSIPLLSLVILAVSLLPIISNASLVSDSSVLVTIVTELATSNPIDSAEVHVGDSITVFSNEDGIVSVPVETGYYEVTVIATGYNTWHQDSVWVEETTILEIEMTQPIIRIEPLEIHNVLGPGGGYWKDYYLQLFNDGNGPYDWHAYIEYIGEILLREYLWDPAFEYNVVEQTGAAGNAGCEFDGTYFYSTRWNSNLMHQYDKNGNLVKEFSIPGVSNIRDLAWDGQFLYGGAAGANIYCFDPINEVLIDVINTSWQYRAIAYDPLLDGFWGNNWSGDIICSDRETGAVVDVIPDPGLSLMYGLAYDGFQGRYLWAFDQGEGAGYPQKIYQINIFNGQLTGVYHDVYQDFPSGIAGGLFLSEYLNGFRVLGGLMQGDPGNDYIFGYNLDEGGWVRLDIDHGQVLPGESFELLVQVTVEWDTMAVWTWYCADIHFVTMPVQDTVTVSVLTMWIEGVNDPHETELLFYPNPCDQHFTVQASVPIRRIRLINYVGQEVLMMDADGTEQVTVNTSGLAEGTYVVEVTFMGSNAASSILIIRHDF